MMREEASFEEYGLIAAGIAVGITMAVVSSCTYLKATFTQVAGSQPSASSAVLFRPARLQDLPFPEADRRLDLTSAHKPIAISNDGFHAIQFIPAGGNSAPAHAGMTIPICLLYRLPRLFRYTLTSKPPATTEPPAAMHL